MTLIGLAVIGALLVLGGVIAFFVSSPASAASDLQAQLTKLVDESTPLEAPGSFEVELKAGGAGFLLSPTGRVGEKVVPVPPASVMYTVAVTDPDGNPVKFEPNRAVRNGSEPFYLVGFCETPKAGKYKIDLNASDGKTPGVILAASMAKDEFETMARAGVAVAVGTIGGCGAICGVVLLLVGGIGAVIVRKTSKPDPLAI